MPLFGRCKVCASKDAHLADLQAQIQDLRRFAIPKNNPHSIPLIQMEADAVLSGQDRVINLPAEEPVQGDRENDEIQSEASRILSGTY